MIEVITIVLIILHKLIAPAIMIPAVVYLWLYFRSKSQRTKRHQPTVNSQTVPRPHAQTAPNRRAGTPIPISLQVHPETRKRLIAMCGGDYALANRLTGGDSSQSAWEKAIYDLEKDRR